MKGPLDLFFKMGEKATKGDPQRQADFIYYMVWILFIAFGTMFVSNLYRLIVYVDIDYLVWALVGFAITVIQYFSLKGMYDMKKMRNQPVKEAGEVESMEEMMKNFESVEKEVDNQDGIRKEDSSNQEGERKASYGATIIPMLQGYGYAAKGLAEQIQATKDHNAPGYIFWNSASDYSSLPEALSLIKD